MSELSEQLKTALLSINVRKEDGEPQVTDPTVDPRLAHIPFIAEMCESYDDRIAAALRRGYRRFAGGKAFTTVDEAKEKVNATVMESMCSLGVTALADGIQFGRKDTPIYRKYKTFDKLGELFLAPTFRETSSLLGVETLDDKDSAQVIRDFVDECFEEFFHETGFCKISESPFSKDPKAINKVWDLWFITMKSAVVGLYVTGYTLGEQRIEAEVLQGILDASMEESTDGE